MRYNIYELHPRYIDNKIYKGNNAPKVVLTLDTGNQKYYQYMKTNWYSELVWKEKIVDLLKLNQKYYVVSEDYTDFGVLVVYKGHTFFDTAEHDERVIVAVELGLTKEQAHIL